MDMSNEIYSVAAQKKNRPSIDMIRDIFITDPVLKKGLDDVLTLLHEYKIKMGWFHTSHWKAKYKGEPILSIKIGNGFKYIENWLLINVETVLPDELTRYLSQFSKDAQDTLAKNICFCNTCGKPKNPCDNVIKQIIINGNEYRNVCKNRHDTVACQCLYDTANGNPLPQDFDITKEFITAKIKHINNKHNKYDNAVTSALKSKIAIAMSESLNGEDKANALKFISFLSENKLSPQHMSPNAWKVNYSDTRIFRIRLDVKKANWTVELMPTLFGNPAPHPTDFDTFIDNENLREFINSKMKICRNCYPKKCARKELSEEFNTICNVNWANPNNEAINNLIKMTDYWKKQELT